MEGKGDRTRELEGGPLLRTSIIGSGKQPKTMEVGTDDPAAGRSRSDVRLGGRERGKELWKWKGRGGGQAYHRVIRSVQDGTSVAAIVGVEASRRGESGKAVAREQ